MNDQPAGTELHRHRTALIVLAAGLALVAASLAWPHLSTGRGEWTDELALKHQSAAANLHGLTHKYSEETSAVQGGKIPDDLRQAQDEFGTLSRQLDAARRRPMQIATALRVVGIGLSIAGAAVYFSSTRK